MKPFFYTFLLVFTCFVFAQQPAKPSSVDLYNQLKKLNFLGSVLYVAAHPDDENTRLISHLSNDVNARTAYLSLTRGDGGQNLIGPELREELGVIRTQELIEARKIDGGIQFFTRANDFGYSKNPDETLQVWNKDQVLSDMVWVIRKFQPDIIINRFDHRTPGTTHGHHTSSALLSMEAFEKANDVNYQSNQLNYVSVFEPKRLFFNTSWWFYGSKEKFEAADKSKLFKIPVGTYYNLLGKSNQEIAALSRSCHQSQGFGTSGTRGEEDEYVEFLLGDFPKEKSSIFNGIDTSWNRIKDGKLIGDLVTTIINEFDFKNPAASIPNLLIIYSMVEKIENQHWKNIKLEEIKKLILGCAGVYFEAVAELQEVTPNTNLKIKVEIVNRSPINIKLNGLETLPFAMSEKETIADLKTNRTFFKNIEVKIPEKIKYTNPYWLNEKGTEGMYIVNEQENIGQPDVIRNLKVVAWLSINNVEIPFERNIVYKYNDDVKGEVYQPLDIVPKVTSYFSEKVYVFNNGNPKTISVKVKAGIDACVGEVKLNLPSDWKVSPSNISFIIDKKNQEFSADFNVTASEQFLEANISSSVTVNGEIFNGNKIDIDYPHIQKQMVLKTAEAKAIRLKLKSKGDKIAYIMGAGDQVPNSLIQMGYLVDIIKAEAITEENLKSYDVVITGIRAYNLIKLLATKQTTLFDFVKNGKTMIVQYNTIDDLVTNEIAPYPLKISRDRVTEENASVMFLNPNHRVLNFPNKITEEDFKNWKQEQGLYYPNEWDVSFTPILSSNDLGEIPKKGSLLIAKYGKGHYVYTGLSFFRELPEGVIGAYRLIANIIALGQ